jgi:NAD(P)-dependent dehydrogenase (short-subunit alcohol dehydrogenase family)
MDNKESAMQKLKDKVVLITGGSSGIGLATAQLFQAQGAQLAITGRDPQTLEQAGAALGGGALLIRSDAGQLAAIDDVMAQVRARYGRLDVLFINAGVAKPAPIEQTTEAAFDEQLGVNLKGVFFTIQKALPLFGASGGSIIVTTSIANQLGSPMFSVYGAAKAGLRSLVKSLGLELVGRGIRVNAISPGPIATPMFERLGLPPEVASAKKQAIAEKSPSRRFGAPEEVAKAALFLASDDSSYIVGDEIVVDGGMSLL